MPTGYAQGAAPRILPPVVAPGAPGTVPGVVPNYNAQTTDINALLSPPDSVDVRRFGAENAVAGGYAGSPFANLATANLSEQDKLNRMLLGSKMLSGQVGDTATQSGSALDAARFELQQRQYQDSWMNQHMHPEQFNPVGGPTTGPVISRGGGGGGGGGGKPAPDPMTQNPFGGDVAANAAGTAHPNPNTSWLQQIMSQYMAPMGGPPGLWQMHSGEAEGATQFGAPGAPSEAVAMAASMDSPDQAYLDPSNFDNSEAY